MSINQDVFLSILAMDAYNRGSESTFDIGEITKIGNATIINNSDALFGEGGTASGFYAVAYSWNGQTIISYRGTNTQTEYVNEDGTTSNSLAKDMLNGWTLGAGYSESTQGAQAIEFYEAVTGKSVYESDASVILTGHSLGGGLAGYVASLSENVAYVFDWEPFSIATWAKALTDAIEWAASESQVSYNTIAELIEGLASGSLPEIVNGTVTLTDFVQKVEQYFTYLYPSDIDINGYYVDGEPLEYIRTAQSVLGSLFGTAGEIFGEALGSATALESQVDSNEIQLYGAELGLLEKHSMSLATILMFGEKEWEVEEGSSSWKSSIKYIIPSIFDDNIADDIAGKNNYGGYGELSADQMASMIAYSAIDTEDGTVFGNTAIRALFDDADDFGDVVSLLPSFISEDIKAEIGSLVTEFAGLLAENVVLSTSWTSAVNGILTSAGTSAGASLAIDLTDNKWSLNGSLSEAVRPDSVNALIEDLIGATSEPLADQSFVISKLRDWMATQTGKAADDVFEQIDAITLALSGGSLEGYNDSSKYQVIVGSEDADGGQIDGNSVIFLGAGGSDTFFGTANSDALLGGTGDDVLAGRDGDDFFYGDVGSDTIWGDSVGDFAGTSGHDSVVYNAYYRSYSIRYNGSASAQLTIKMGSDTDTLYGVEDIYIEGSRNTFSMSGHILAGTDLTIHNGEDASGLKGGQIINVARMDGGVVVDLHDPDAGVITDKKTGGSITLEGFHTQIIGTDYDDEFYDGSDETKVISAGDGSDFVSVEGTEQTAIIFGGEGSDEIVGSDANDYIIDQNTKLSDARKLTKIDRNGNYTYQWVYGSVGGGAGDDTIVVSYQEPSETLAGYVIDPGAGDDIVNIASGTGTYYYKYQRGDGSDEVAVNSEATFSYYPRMTHSGSDEYVKEAVFQIDLSAYSSSEVSVSFQVKSATMVREDLPNMDMLPLWQCQGDIIITLADGGQIKLTDVTVFTQSDSYDTYYDAPTDFSDFDLSYFYADDDTSHDFPEGMPIGITTSDGGAISVNSGSAAMSVNTSDSSGASGDDGSSSSAPNSVTPPASVSTSSEAASSTDDQDVELAPGSSSYTGGTGVDRLTVTWDIGSLQSSYSDGTLVVSDKWGLIGTTTLVDFDEVYVVAEDQTYSIEDFNEYVANYSPGADVYGTDGNDQLSGTAKRDNIYGYGGEDTLTGFGGADLLDGGADADVMLGGADDDIYVVDDAGDVVSEDIDGGVDTVRADIDYVLPENVENLQLVDSAVNGIGNDLNNNITGNWSNNVLLGGAGDDVLDGVGGTDTLIGGVGDDNYYTSYYNVTIVENEGEGVDTVYTYASDIITPDNIERLVLLSSDQQATASDLGTEIRGGDWGNILIGGAASDFLYGGASGDEIDGKDGDDYLVGGGGWNDISGGIGNDIIISGGGDSNGGNWIDGGDGVDTVKYEGSSADYTIAVDPDGTTYVYNDDLSDILTNVENIYFRGDGITLTAADLVPAGTIDDDVIVGTSHGDTLYGDDGNDTLTGGLGRDDIDGGLGADSMIGGQGDDTYYVDNAGDQITELQSEGSDFVYTEIDFTLPANVENMDLWSPAVTGIGNELDNTIYGSVLDNSLFGLGGDDILMGEDGNDTIEGGAGDDLLVGGNGTDVAVFSGAMDSYSLITGSGAIQVVDNDAATDGADGTDTFIGIETAEFKNGETVNLAAPIALDLDGDGVVELVDRDQGVTFDWNGDGTRDSTGWVAGDDGLLFFDRNGDGTVTDATELSFTSDKDGARSDLDGLTAFDTNGDGVFSALDDQFAEFYVWQDQNQDGSVKGGEVLTLEQAGVTSINLSGDAVEQSWEWDDNVIVNTGSYSGADGSQKAFADVALNYISSPSEVSNDNENAAPSASTTSILNAAANLSQAISTFSTSEGTVEWSSSNDFLRRPSDELAANSRFAVR